MVYLAYLGKEYGLSKLGIVILGIITVSLGSYGYFNSVWVKNNVNEIVCSAKGNEDVPKEEGPSIALEKVFIAVEIFCVTLSTLGLVGNLFSKQLSDPIFKHLDICYNGCAGLTVIIGGSLFLYSTVTIDNLFTDIKELDLQCTITILQHPEFQLYNAKISAGALSLFQGLLYFVTAALLALR